MRIILLGPPGSGKGSLAKALCKKLPFVHVSTGDLFRQHIKDGTPLGMSIRHYMDAGELVPDELTVQLVTDVLQDEKVRDNFMLDGFPRNIQQAEALEAVLEPIGMKLDCVLHVIVPDEMIVNRVSGRRLCKGCGYIYNMESHPPMKEGICNICGQEVYQRPDDNPEVIEDRLKTYHGITEPLVDFYQKRTRVIDLDNSGDLEDVVNSALALLSEAKE